MRMGHQAHESRPAEPLPDGRSGSRRKWQTVGALALALAPACGKTTEAGRSTTSAESSSDSRQTAIRLFAEKYDKTTDCVRAAFETMPDSFLPVIIASARDEPIRAEMTPEISSVLSIAWKCPRGS